MAIVRIAALKNFLDTALSTSLNGTAYDLGALTATQKLIGVFHLTSGYSNTGRVLVATIQCASSSGFTTLSTSFSFSISTAIGSTWPASVAVSTDRKFFRGTFTMSTAASTGGTWKGLIGVGVL